MVRAMRTRMLAFLCICILCINVAIAEDPRLKRLQQRQDSSDTRTTTRGPSQTSSAGSEASISGTPTSGKGSSTSTGSRSEQESKTTNLSVSESKAIPTASNASTTATSIPSSTVPSNINAALETDSFNGAKYNYTATPNLLPLQPEITPAFAVGGIILILTGAVFALVGIKNKFLHVFLSVAYLASVSVTVLILYVMNPPVSNAIQGAYLVAIVVTGLILGGASIVFTEMTEGLGCLLGGFCFSMWLLVLKPGGLITSTGGKAIFISAFTLVAFATSFTHYTRDYGLIISISFGGSTAIVLGIDCFSRAGLKEFWAYLWNLNDNLFPLGATSYPLTRGMKVEIAAIIVIFLAGIVSQMKLWKVIKERREHRAAERLQDKQNLEQEEANVGRRIENRNARDRDQWEAVYGDKDAAVTRNLSQRDSGVGDMESQKKDARSTVTSIPRSGEDEIEMSEMTPRTNMHGAGLVMANNNQDGITVRVARDMDPPPNMDEKRASAETQKRFSQSSLRSNHIEQPQEEKVWVMGSNGEARLEQRLSKRSSRGISSPRISTAPEVVPLPFKVPEAPEGDVNSNRSSVATFADEDSDANKRNSKYLSAGSAIIRKLSKRSERNSRTLSRGNGFSTEDLVTPQVDDDRASSVAATMDGLSDDEDLRSIRSSFDKAPNTDEARSSLPSSDPVATAVASHEPSSSADAAVEVAEEERKEAKPRPTSDATEATNILDLASPKDTELEGKSIKKSLTSSTDLKPPPAPSADVAQEQADGEVVGKAKAVASVVSAVDTKPASITKERLPQLSKVVMSYRTNEWAKHLSTADAPEIDELKIEENPVEAEHKAVEVPAPVNVDELQQTAENAAPPPMPRSISQVSHYAAPQSLSRSGPTPAHLDVPLNQGRSESAIGLYQDGNMPRSMSQQSIHRQSSQQSINNRNLVYRSSSSPLVTQPIVESPIEDDNSIISNHNESYSFQPQVTPFGSTSTLMGHRDSILRSKNQYSGSSPALASTPEFPPQHYNTGTLSDAGPAYNHANSSATGIIDDDGMSLSARRNLIRQSSALQNPTTAPQSPSPYDSHQPRRQSSAPSPLAREQQLASWRANVAQDLQSTTIPKSTIERSRSALWQERQAEDYRRAMDAKKKGDRDHAFNERMRRGDMIGAHRDALRKMQANAHVT